MGIRDVIDASNSAYRIKEGFLAILTPPRSINTPQWGHGWFRVVVRWVPSEVTTQKPVPNVFTPILTVNQSNHITSDWNRFQTSIRSSIRAGTLSEEDVQNASDTSFSCNHLSDN
jgi:hypothetical protein